MSLKLNPASSRPPRSFVTIERLRTLVLVGGIVLVAGIAVFLALGKWKRLRQLRDLPGQLGVDIQQNANGVDYTQSRKGKTLFHIHAARAVQMKAGNKTTLHDVRIDLYGDDGRRTDTISGSEFTYDPVAGIAQAAGAVDITLMRPGVQPAIAQLKPGTKSVPSPVPVPAIPGSLADNEIHVKTSGLLFNQKSGIATTEKRVDFTLRQGRGNSLGATYDSAKGQLILDQQVELHVDRNQGPVTVHAAHAEFERTGQQVQMSQALADYNGGSAKTASALIHFRDDGSVIRLDGSGGVDLQSSTGGHMAAPRANLEFDTDNHPTRGVLEGGATLAMLQPLRQTQGAAPTIRLGFDREGQLQHAHLEQGVQFKTVQQAQTAKGQPVELKRDWHSQVADIDFAPVVQTRLKGQGSVEPRNIYGTGRVTIDSDTSGASGAVTGIAGPSKLSADQVQAALAPGSVLSTLTGTGHAIFEETTATGAHQTSSSDQLDVTFVPARPSPSQEKAPLSKPLSPTSNPASEIATVVAAGHVVLIQDPPPPKQKSKDALNPKVSGPTLPGKSSDPAGPTRATAARADYDAQTQLVHLTGQPRIRDGALDLTATRIDFSRSAGDAYARGDVRASWTNSGEPAAGNSPSGKSAIAIKPPDSPPSAGVSLTSGGSSVLPGNGPVHAIADEAELHQESGDIVFHSATNGPGTALPRLWQGPNSITAPLITLNRKKETLTAQSNLQATPVRTVLLSNSSNVSKTPSSNSEQESESNKPDSLAGKDKSKTTRYPSVIRLKSGDVHYSEGERLATFHAGVIGTVTAETSGPGGEASIVSQQAELLLLPAGTRATKTATAPATSTSSGSALPAPTPSVPSLFGSSSVDTLTAIGHVSVDWPARRGTGEKLVYHGDDQTFTLTGTSAAPPRITDEQRGTVTGSALIFHSRDDSVTVEGDGRKTLTETHSEKKSGSHRPG